MQSALSAACEEIREFEARIAAVEKQLRVLAQRTPVLAGAGGQGAGLGRVRFFGETGWIVGSRTVLKSQG